MNFRFLLIIITSTFLSMNGMQQEPQKKSKIVRADLYINYNPHKNSAVYGSGPLHETLRAVDIQTDSLNILIPVKTEPAVQGMPTHFPVKELLLYAQDTQLPYMINGKQTILTCKDNPEVLRDKEDPKSVLSFHDHCKECIENFNLTPAFGYHQDGIKEYRILKEELQNKGLIKQKKIFSHGPYSLTTPQHDDRRFKPKRHLKSHQAIYRRQITGKKLSTLE